MLSTVFSDRQLRDAFLGDLAEWMVSQRWYSPHGTTPPTLRVAGWARLGDTPQRTTTFASFITDDNRRFAIPLTWTYLTEVAFADASALIATLDTPSGTIYIADATAVPEARAMLFAGLARGHVSGEAITITTHFNNDSTLECADKLCSLHATERVTADQSNTSLIASCSDSSRVIMKIYRQLHEGENPDITLQRALHNVGNTRIAPFVGSVHMTDAVGSSDIALIQSYLPESPDAWHESLAAASSDASFTDRAATLGVALARVHADLESSLPTHVASINTVRPTLKEMTARFERFSAAAPALEDVKEAVQETYARATTLMWPAFQRIHGDLRLEQVLNSPERGWVFLGFEGAAHLPLFERTRPDSIARDVAAILRSIDYAAAFAEINNGAHTTTWLADTRKAFLDAYLREYLALHEGPSHIAAAPEADLRSLITVFEIDAAAHDAAREAQRRPEWAKVPLRTLAQLTNGAEEC